MITKIKTLTDILQKKFLLERTKKTLLLFDIDNVLIAPKDLILGPSGYALGNLLMKKYTNVKNNLYYFSLILQQAEFIVVENKAIDLIKFLKSRENISVLGITKSKMGWNKYLTNSYENIKLNLLNKYGFDFHSDYYYDASILTFKKKSNHLKFLEGVIFANQFSKGKALEYFLDYFNMDLNLIVMVDDELSNLLSVQKLAKKKNLKYEGYHFQSTKLYGNTLNTLIAEKQFKYLIKTGLWLNEKDIRSIPDSC